MRRYKTKKKREKKTKDKVPGLMTKDKKHKTVVTEIINLRHLEWFQLASDVTYQRA